MDINSPSLYAAFGSKENLFREATDLYLAEYGSTIWDALATSGTAREAVEAVLRKTVALFTKPGNPRACLIVSSMINCQELSVRNFLREKRRVSLDALRRRLEQGIVDGDLPRRANVDAATEFYGIVQQGLSLRTRESVSREAMHEVVRIAMAAWDVAIGPNRSGTPPH